MYGCEIWSMKQGDENKLLTFERKVIRKIYGPVLNPITNLYERRKNCRLKQTVQYSKSTRLKSLE